MVGMISKEIQVVMIFKAIPKNTSQRMRLKKTSLYIHV